MAKITIRLPPASPHAYLAWVAWWKDTEELVGSDLASQPASRWPGGADPGEQLSRSIIGEHLFLIEGEAKLAIDAGRDEIAPELSAETGHWGQWLRYGKMRRDWLEALALKSLPQREFPESVETLWRDTMRVVQAVVSDRLVLHNVQLTPDGEPGRFLIRGELEVANIEAVADRLGTELESGHRLHLDLSGVKFIDSQGVHLLVRLAALATELSLPPVILFAPSEEVSRVLDIAVPEGIPGLEIRPMD
jgi:anti-anti-sigma factor